MDVLILKKNEGRMFYYKYSKQEKVGNIIDGYEQSRNILMIFLSSGWYVDDRDNYIRRIL